VEYRIVYKHPAKVLASCDKKKVEIERVPNYACRPLISFDIIRNCVDLGYAMGLISFSDDSLADNEMAKFSSILEGPKTKKVQNLEEKLWSVFASAFSDNFPDEYIEIADQRGVLDGYSLLLKLFTEEND